MPGVWKSIVKFAVYLALAPLSAFVDAKLTASADADKPQESGDASN